MHNSYNVLLTNSTNIHVQHEGFVVQGHKSWQTLWNKLNFFLVFHIIAVKVDELGTTTVEIIIKNNIYCQHNIILHKSNTFPPSSLQMKSFLSGKDARFCQRFQHHCTHTALSIPSMPSDSICLCNSSMSINPHRQQTSRPLPMTEHTCSHTPVHTHKNR